MGTLVFLLLLMTVAIVSDVEHKASRNGTVLMQLQKAVRVPPCSNIQRIGLSFADKNYRYQVNFKRLRPVLHQKAVQRIKH